MEGLTPGRVVDRYVVEGRVNRGGMATVYRVRHLLLDSLHALKVLHLHQPEVGQRLLIEGKLQASLQHPNLLRVTDVLHIDGAPSLVMDYIDGPDLESWLQGGPRGLQESLGLLEGALTGIVFAHARGFVHRDLKPGNVLLSPLEGGWLPKVADFGLAKVLSSVLESPLETATGLPMGTPAYMAPEQVRSAKDVDHRADIWSLGCILYRIATGTTPFQADNLLELYGRIVVGEYIDVALLAPDLHPRLVESIRGCLEVDPAARIQTVLELRAAIREVLCKEDNSVEFQPLAPDSKRHPTASPIAESDPHAAALGGALQTVGAGPSKRAPLLRASAGAQQPLEAGPDAPSLSQLASPELDSRASLLPDSYASLPPVATPATPTTHGKRRGWLWPSLGLLAVGIFTVVAVVARLGEPAAVAPQESLLGLSHDGPALEEPAPPTEIGEGAPAGVPVLDAEAPPRSPSPAIAAAAPSSGHPKSGPASPPATGARSPALKHQPSDGGATPPAAEEGAVGPTEPAQPEAPPAEAVSGLRVRVTGEAEGPVFFVNGKGQQLMAPSVTVGSWTILATFQGVEKDAGIVAFDDHDAEVEVYCDAGAGRCARR